jgi:transporter family-2 protein
MALCVGSPATGTARAYSVVAVSGGTTVAAILALTAGLAGAVQAAVMGRFGERVGSLEAVTWALLLSVVLALAVLLVARRGLGNLADAASAPKWLWLGALLGTFIVFTITVASPRIGTTATIALLVAGQLAMGAVIDRWGLFGFERIALSWPRALGIALLAAGAALTLKR